MTTQLTLVDPSRGTPASDSTEALTDRTITVTLHLPEASGPAPLLVFSHGMDGHPEKFTALLETWAAAGYAVAAPAFPLTNAGVDGAWDNFHDVNNQAGDIAFVLSHLLDLAGSKSSDLSGRFDPTALGAAGLSAGAFTTYAAAVDDRTRDQRFQAAIVMSGVMPDGAAFVPPADLPVLIFQGDLDPLISVPNAAEAYNRLRPDRYFVELLGGGHAGPYEDAAAGFEPKIPGHDDLIHAATTAFWDRYLRGSTGARNELLAAADRPELATFLYDIDS